jgi:hypothetical protein
MKFTKETCGILQLHIHYADFINEYTYERRSVYEQELNILIAWNKIVWQLKYFWLREKAITPINLLIKTVLDGVILSMNISTTAICKK